MPLLPLSVASGKRLKPYYRNIAVLSSLLSGLPAGFQQAFPALSLAPCQAKCYNEDKHHHRGREHPGGLRVDARHGHRGCQQIEKKRSKTCFLRFERECVFPIVLFSSFPVISPKSWKSPAVCSVLSAGVSVKRSRQPQVAGLSGIRAAGL